MTNYETILVEKNDGITTIRLNRPDKKNAMNPTLHREMHAALRSLEFDDETQVSWTKAQSFTRDLYAGAPAHVRFGS